MAAIKTSQGSEWLRRGMRCFDAAVAIIVSLSTLWLMPNIEVDGHDYLFLILIGSLLLPAVGELLGLYHPWRGRSLYTMLGVYSLSWMVTIALISLLLVATQSTQYFSRLWMGNSAVVALVAGMATRMLLYAYLRSLRASGANIKRVLLIGHSSNVKRIENRLRSMPYAGYGINDTYEDDNSAAFIETIIALADSCAFERDFDEIWLSYPLSDGEKVRRLSASLIGIPVNVRYFPDLTDIRLLNHRMAQVVGLYSLELNYSPLDSAPLRLLKSIEDYVLGTLIFIVFLPVMLAVAGLVKYKMGGPVLFKQYRHGLDGKRFRIYKFRTMSLHHAKHTQQARYGDPRITPLGAFLRRSSLDELPQLYNVLQGRMSLVGPRPHAMDHNEYYKDVIEDYMQRHRVKPGMTGWAQVHGWRGNTDALNDMKKRVEYDLYYIDNWSLGLDIKILAMTLSKGFMNQKP
ncbi:MULTISPECIES: undecaprenyl-phosphate glucose phosphotransferase [unclassified Halomonas]|uniref:undecaprenyl-phosphate glucose phosphotransferase n=1 Tax=unclassified Halomonas TaxID=2609666 RepID=UPI0007D9CCD8|nr:MULTISPECIES: undecaprenyl-phosphate glucose phosphotransferase [unclassified Halomonas]MBT2787205.1 undecaprenyl-phosphate glucose phosphotransferase [Halomonas sp. ISL-106]MBT2796431.1 undecaprenyl-phosphate glucose phosphotransferase [Halomonas sp. ISL-104]OAL57803.1 undecaprenyl-phosphate glucose phosphotransferase [Halomonas sp. ALS9]